MSSNITRFEIFSIEEVFNLVEKYVNWHKSYKMYIILHHMKVNLTSDRYSTFMRSGTVCKECGLEGKYFALEISDRDMSNRGTAHFNLYGINYLGQEILMTKDHIVPRCEGGKNNIRNYQTLCTLCNSKKGLIEGIRFNLIKDAATLSESYAVI